MKKIVFCCLIALVSLSANAQFHFGGQFAISFDNEHTDYSSGYVDNKEKAYLIKLMPKVYWNLNEKMQIGGRVGFAFGRLTTGLVYDSDKKVKPIEVNRAIGWSLAPFYGYKLLNWKSVSIWAEANAFVGQYYNVNGPDGKATEWDKQTEYGFQILPLVNIDLTEKLALQIHLGFISLGWYGTTASYPEKVVTTSSWDMHKGGFVGLAQGLADYGICLVKKF